jgi:hypothetical protein
MKNGDLVEITSNGRTVVAKVVLASPNGRSLMLIFEASFCVGDGFYLGEMPVLQGDDGVYRDLFNNEPVEIKVLTQ